MKIPHLYSDFTSKAYVNHEDFHNQILAKVLVPFKSVIGKRFPHEKKKAMPSVLYKGIWQEPDDSLNFYFQSKRPANFVFYWADEDYLSNFPMMSLEEWVEKEVLQSQHILELSKAKQLWSKTCPRGTSVIVYDNLKQAVHLTKGSEFHRRLLPAALVSSEGAGDGLNHTYHENRCLHLLEKWEPEVFKSLTEGIPVVTEEDMDAIAHLYPMLMWGRGRGSHDVDPKVLAEYVRIMDKMRKLENELY